MSPVLYVSLAIFLILVVFFSVEIVQLRRIAKRRHDDIEFNLRQLQRAIGLVGSDDRDNIFRGLHILSAINHPARLKALPRLATLASHHDSHIAGLAKRIITEMGEVAPSPTAKRKPLAKTKTEFTVMR